MRKNGLVYEYDVTGSMAFSTPGIYTVELSVTDNKGATGTASTVGGALPAYVVVFDPLGSFVTGGGWIWSPPGAYRPGITEYAMLEGKATFGFVAKYLKDTNIPTGDTKFQFKAGDLNFISTEYQWLVVAGARAQYKGSGTINGTGDYGFMLTAIDGQVPGGRGYDRFRIKIQDKVTDLIIYDNMVGALDNSELPDSTIIRGGSIVIH